MINKNYWQGGVNEIITKVLNGKRNINQAVKYMEENFLGENSKSFKHLAFENTSADTFAELEVYNLLRDAIKLGYGKDYNLEKVFR